MTIGIPWPFALKVLGKISKLAYEWTTSWIFMPTLLASHNMWLSRRRLGSHWTEIGCGIEYSTHLPTKHFENTQNPVARLALRCRDTRYDAAIVTLEARNGNVAYDETRMVSGLGSGNNIRVVTLPGIPLQDIFSLEDGIGCTYSSFRVRITSLTENGTARAVDLSGPSSSPTYTDYLNGRFAWRKGFAFNMDEIEWQKTTMREAVWGWLGVHPEPVFVRMRPPLLRPFYRLRQGIAWLTASKPVIALAFWLPIAMRLREFKESE